MKNCTELLDGTQLFSDWILLRSNSPENLPEIIQLGFKQGIISDGEAWIQMMLSRNALSHLYDEKTSREIYEQIKMCYIKLFNELKEKFELI